MRQYYSADLNLIFQHARRPRMPAQPFALLDAHPVSDKPKTFQTIDALAARIHKLRRDAALNLSDFDLTFRGEATPRRAVAIQTQGDDGAPAGFLGYAWIGGAGWRTLQAALYAQQPNPAERAEAA